MRHLCAIVVAALVAGSAAAQDCFDGFAIFPTATPSFTYWGYGGIEQSGQDLFMAGRQDWNEKISILRPNATGTMAQVQQVNAPSLSHFSANADVLAVASATITSNGQVLVYTKVAATGQYALTTTITSTQSGQDFARRVAVSEDGNTLAVSAPGLNATDAGKVSIYSRSPSGVWSLAISLTVPGSKQLGKYLSFWGTRLAISEGASDKIHIFGRQGSVYVLSATVTTQVQGNYARGIALSQDTLVIRSLSSASGPADRYEIFELMDDAWIRQTSLNLSGSLGFDFEYGVLAVSFLIGDTIQARAYRKQGTSNEWANFFTGNSTTGDTSYAGGISVESDRLAIAMPDFSNSGCCNSNGAAFLFDAVYVDCNANGKRDECDIAAGTSVDSNGNLTPDECENSCASDFNGDGIVDGADLGRLLTDWGACP
jgi:hypothetical protein